MMRWVFDLDGVIWLGVRAIPGSAEAVARIRSSGADVAFVTNNSAPTRAANVRMLEKAGVDADESEVVTSAQAGASMFPEGSRVAVIGGDGITEALADRGITVVDADDDPSGILVGRDLELDHDRLAAAAQAIRCGARFVATNADATFPTGDELMPGAGAIVAYLSTASGVSAEVAGKPHRPIADLVRDRLGRVDIMVGDRPDTDGLFAELIDARFALVLSGVTTSEDLPATPAPELVGSDLSDIVAQVLDGR